MTDETVPDVAPVAATAAATTPNSTIAKLTMQLKRLNEANGKYKNLVKMAKERIQQQEEEIAALKESASAQTAKQSAAASEASLSALNASHQQAASEDNNTETTIVAVCQRIRVSQDEIWALFQYETRTLDGDVVVKRYKAWKDFHTDHELQDYIRRDTGEPLVLPAYSLTPQQSAQVQAEAASQVSKVTEEFRKFKIKAELAKKQLQSQIRDWHTSQVQSVAESPATSNASAKNGSTNNAVLIREQELRAEMAAQEAHWKEAYNVLLAENQALQSSGSEGLVASQWRHRYETCLQEKQDLEARLSSQNNGDDGDKYEAKYRDLKESFRLYRKKAKEIFEEQKEHGGGSGAAMMPQHLSQSSSADAKLSYLKNLMVNYFLADPAMRDPMQMAIGTVLQFTPDELEKIEKKRLESEAWF